jgi:mono/diheme cytochrome c family protein
MLRYLLRFLGVAFLLAAPVACTTSEMRSPPSFGGGSGGVDPGASGSGGFVIPPSGGAGSTGAGGAVAPPSNGCPGSNGSTSAGPGAPPPAMPRLPPDFRPNFDGPAVRAAVPPPPLSGGTLHVLASGTAAVMSDPDRDRVYVVDLRTGKVRSDVALSANDEPGRIAEDKVGRVHIALRRGGALVTLDPMTGTITARRDACPAPRGVAYEAANDRVHVACAGGELVSFAAAGGAAVRTLSFERDLRDVVVSGASLLVSKFRSAEVLVIGADGVAASRVTLPSRQRARMPMVQTLTPAVAWRMQAVTGGAVIVHQRGVDSELSITPGGYAGGGKGCEGVVETVVTKVMAGQMPEQSPGLSMSVLPIDIALSADGRQAAIVSAGNAGLPALPQVTVSPIDMLTPKGMDCAFPGGVPGPSVVPPVGAVTQPVPPGQAVAVAFLADNTIAVQTREPATLWLGSTGQVISLGTESRADTGQQVFHTNAGGGVACASCHPEGGEDGRVWKFACIGARRTQSMRGGIIGTEPFHWDGDMTTFTTLVHEVFEGRMSGPPLKPETSDALLAWIDKIPTLPVRAGVDRMASERGRVLFNDTTVACASCHAGERLTNNKAADVGTGKMFQVPSLRNVAARAPFLHDGCAPTLQDRFGACGGGDKHGKTSALTPAQLADLISYLETL